MQFVFLLKCWNARRNESEAMTLLCTCSRQYMQSTGIRMSFANMWCWHPSSQSVSIAMSYQCKGNISGLGFRRKKKIKVKGYTTASGGEHWIRKQDLSLELTESSPAQQSPSWLPLHKKYPSCSQVYQFYYRKVATKTVLSPRIWPMRLAL